MHSSLASCSSTSISPANFMSKPAAELAAAARISGRSSSTSLRASRRNVASSEATLTVAVRVLSALTSAISPK